MERQFPEFQGRKPVTFNMSQVEKPVIQFKNRTCIDDFVQKLQICSKGIRFFSKLK